MRYLIAYDIASDDRRRRVARRLEQKALRRQKSVFVFTGGRRALDGLLRELRELLAPQEDRLQAWKVLDPPQGTSRTAGPSPEPLCLILDTRIPLTVEENSQ